MADPILPCSTWPEVDRERMRPLRLTAEEIQDLKKIHTYSGSMEMTNLFSSASLRTAGVSFIKPTDADKAEAASLVAVVGEGLKEDAPQVVARPEKKLKGRIDPDEMKRLSNQPIKGLASKLARLSAATRADNSKKKGVKRSRAEEVAQGRSEPILVDLGGVAGEGVGQADPKG